MAKKESSFKNMFITLFVVTFTASAVLGGVYLITKEPIAIAQRAKQEAAIKMVLPSFDTIETKVVATGVENEAPLTFNYAYQDSVLVGAAIETYTNMGFSGLIRLMVGFKPDGEIVSVAVLEHKETPGLGTKMADSPFKDQFIGRNPGNFKLQVKKDGGEVDAITAATITSRAYCDALKRAYETLQKEGGNKE